MGVARLCRIGPCAACLGTAREQTRSARRSRPGYVELARARFDVFAAALPCESDAAVGHGLLRPDAPGASRGRTARQRIHSAWASPSLSTRLEELLGRRPPYGPQRATIGRQRPCAGRGVNILWFIKPAVDDVRQIRTGHVPFATVIRCAYLHDRPAVKPISAQCADARSTAGETLTVVPNARATENEIARTSTRVPPVNQVVLLT